METGTAAQFEIDHFMEGLRKRNPGETEFHQAVHEVVESLMPFVLDHATYRDAHILGENRYHRIAIGQIVM